MEKAWEEMTAMEKQEARFEKWILRPDIRFKNNDVEARYRARATRIKDAVQLRRTPDRIPIAPLFTFMPGFIYGVTPYDMMHTPELACAAFKKYLHEFEPDLYFTIEGIGCGQALEILDNKTLKWPGHGVPRGSGYQFVEDQYMKEDEYSAFLGDLSGFELRRYLPRASGALHVFEKFPPVGALAGPHSGRTLGFFGREDVSKALKALLDAGRIADDWISVTDKFKKEAEEGMGFTCVGFPGALSPFDYFADLMRGSTGMMMDMYRQPDRMLEAIQRMVPAMIHGAVSAADEFNNPLVFMPLHKGADGWISYEQFRKFYWPSLKEVVMGLVDEGCVPLLFAEGGYNTRLEYLNEIPKSSCIWMFDRTDMKKAKKVAGESTCIMGNVPAGLLLTSTPDKVGDYCRDLIDTAGRDGGYIMAAGAALDEVNVQNLRVMFDVTGEYGRY